MPPRGVPACRPRGERRHDDGSADGAASSGGVGLRRAFVPGMILTKQSLIPVKASPAYPAGGGRERGAGSPSRPHAPSSRSNDSLSSSASGLWAQKSSSGLSGSASAPDASSSKAGSADRSAPRGAWNRGDSSSEKPGLSSLGVAAGSCGGRGEREQGRRLRERRGRADELEREAQTAQSSRGEERETRASDASRVNDGSASGCRRDSDNPSDKMGRRNKAEGKGKETGDREGREDREREKETKQAGKPATEGATSENVQATTQAYKAKTKTKVAVRLLPPSVREEELFALVAESVQEKIAWTRFVPGCQHKPGESSRNSTWYVNFAAEEDAEEFIKSFHGKAFVDERHNTFKAVARLAPYQKVPRKTGPDRREGTLANDSLYLDFLRALNDGTAFDPRAVPPGSEELEPVVDDDGITLSSLVLALREKYGVKTMVKGCPYTLAMWRRTFSVADPDEEERASSRTTYESERRDANGELGVRRRGKGPARAGRETRRMQAASAPSVETAAASGETGLRRQTPGSSVTPAISAEAPRPTPAAGATGSGARGGVWRALLGIQKRATTAGGAEKAENEEAARSISG
ncbi:hypothetical protein NCLIV_058400 [Neospora caninum Liverpool]|uniref:Smg-4/UPF3 family protein n=1 Tax=Neospora caninum (strain Liverpool) TaxID=572307 RepID=F0VNX1_NEOCL|nr:hypothetical protein NCLIV_058400 [Neospora caninum Liverpool]CBZ55417.1 hypothetical protein NCLIV_058400 [Neospora caninum Liverpool]CEL70153.1 TPA: Smg-4/UPF3 family protein [Neospora caninum Liverpool]|eukprot:XP_003885445.1 hypothetical protein NCLIV_058400 [Neospora caninum Liverpool]